MSTGDVYSDLHLAGYDSLLPGEQIDSASAQVKNEVFLDSDLLVLEQLQVDYLLQDVADVKVIDDVEDIIMQDIRALELEPEMSVSQESTGMGISEAHWSTLGIYTDMMKYMYSDLWKLPSDSKEDEIFREDEKTGVSCDCQMKKACKYSNCYLNLCEIVNHDCMWTGLCVSRDHKDYSLMQSVLRTPKTEPRFAPRPVSPGKSVLIPKQTSAGSATSGSSVGSPFGSADSEGDSLRPDTPLSSDSDDEIDGLLQGNIFKHDELCFDSLLDCKSVPMNDVLNQKYVTSYCRARRDNDRRKEEVEQRLEHDIEEMQVQTPESMSSDDGDRHETETAQTTCPVIPKSQQNWLSDHCYHLNKPEEPRVAMPKKMDNLGVQTPSDSEEEIDVVSFDKPSRTTTFPRHLMENQHNRYLSMMASALCGKKKQQQHQQQQNPAPRQRGRPRGSTRKRALVTGELSQPSKRTKATRPYNRKNGRYGRAFDDSETDSERRSTHNNMERTRRSQLKSHFEFLRKQVPLIENNEKAAKVEILRQARIYILDMENVCRESLEQCNMLKARQQRLKSKLSDIRRDLASQGWSHGHRAE